MHWGGIIQSLTDYPDGKVERWQGRKGLGGKSSVSWFNVILTAWLFDWEGSMWTFGIFPLNSHLIFLTLPCLIIDLFRAVFFASFLYSQYFFSSEEVFKKYGHFIHRTSREIEASVFQKSKTPVGHCSLRSEEALQRSLVNSLFFFPHRRSTCYTLGDFFVNFWTEQVRTHWSMRLIDWLIDLTVF